MKGAGESKLETQPQSIGIHLMDWGLSQLIEARVSFLKGSAFVEIYLLEPHTNLTSDVSTVHIFRVHFFGLWGCNYGMILLFLIIKEWKLKKKKKNVDTN